VFVSAIMLLISICYYDRPSSSYPVWDYFHSLTLYLRILN